MPSLKDIVDQVQSIDNKTRINEDISRFKMYQGNVRGEIKKAIGREFVKPETIEELSSRIIPINIMQKIITKLAAVYQKSPTRSPADKNEQDQEYLDSFSGQMRIDQKMKFANRFFKLHKHTTLEPFLDFQGKPKLRVLPSQTYTPISTDSVDPQRVTAFVKHIRFDTHDAQKSRFQVWTDEEFFIVNGKGDVVSDEMAEINNPNGENPFKTIPFVYISETDDGFLIPTPDDDLKAMQIAIPLLLTDLAFASKYQLWSILAIIGGDAENITFNPNSVMSLPAGADLKVIKPQVDIDQGLRQIEAYISMLLTTKNLSVGDVSGSLSTQNISSGVAKMLDRAETTEDRKDQEAFFRDAEKELWDKLAHSMIPYWVSSGRIHEDFNVSFSTDFKLSIKYADPKPFIGDKDLVDLEISKMKEGLTTKKMALKVIHPELDSDQVDSLEAEIQENKSENVKRMNALFGQDNSEPQNQDGNV